MEAMVVLVVVFGVVIEAVAFMVVLMVVVILRCGDRKCHHCNGTNHIVLYCWVKYGKPDYVHQVIDGTTPYGHETLGSHSRNALTLGMQLSKLIQHPLLPLLHQLVQVMLDL